MWKSNSLTITPKKLRVMANVGVRSTTKITFSSASQSYTD